MSSEVDVAVEVLIRRAEDNAFSLDRERRLLFKEFLQSPRGPNAAAFSERGTKESFFILRIRWTLNLEFPRTRTKEDSVFSSEPRDFKYDGVDKVSERREGARRTMGIIEWIKRMKSLGRTLLFIAETRLASNFSRPVRVENRPETCERFHGSSVFFGLVHGLPPSNGFQNESLQEIKQTPRVPFRATLELGSRVR